MNDAMSAVRLLDAPADGATLARIERTQDQVIEELRVLRDLVGRQAAAIDEQYVSIKRAAEITALGETTIRRAVLSGDLPASLKGQHKSIYRIAKADLVEWMARGKDDGPVLPGRSALQALIDKHLGGKRGKQPSPASR